MKLSDELLEQVKQKDIVPNTLTGSIADEFRRMVVKAMFPNSKPNPESDAEKRREQRRKSKEGMKAKASGKDKLLSLIFCTDHVYTRKRRFSPSRGRKSKC